MSPWLKSRFLKLIAFFTPSIEIPPYSLLAFQFSLLITLFILALPTYQLCTEDEYTKLQGPHLLLNPCWWQVSPWIVIGACIMSKNDGAGLEPTKVTQSHPFTQTNGINECSLSGTLLQPIRLPISSSVCLLATHYSLSSLWCNAFTVTVSLQGTLKWAAPWSQQTYCHIYWLSQKCPCPFLPA